MSSDEILMAYVQIKKELIYNRMCFIFCYKNPILLKVHIYHTFKMALTLD